MYDLYKNDSTIMADSLYQCLKIIYEIIKLYSFFYHLHVAETHSNVIGKCYL